MSGRGWRKTAVLGSWATAVLLAALGRCGPKAPADVAPLEPEVSKHYVVRVPEDYDRTESYPLVIALHGNDQSERQATRMWDDGVFYMPDFILVGVRAPFRASDGYTWFRSGGDQDEHVEKVHLAAALTCERLVLDITEEVGEQYNVDPDSRIVMGTSMGAAIAYFVVLRNPDVFSGIAEMSGRVTDAILSDITAENAGHLDVFIGMGERESSSAIAAAKDRAERLRRAGAKVRFDLHEEGHVLKASQVRSMENFFELGSVRAPVDDYVYNRDGTPKMMGGPGPDDEYYEDEEEYEDYGGEPGEEY